MHLQQSASIPTASYSHTMEGPRTRMRPLAPLIWMLCQQGYPRAQMCDASASQVLATANPTQAFNGFHPGTTPKFARPGSAEGGK